MADCRVWFRVSGLEIEMKGMSRQLRPLKTLEVCVGFVVARFIVWLAGRYREVAECTSGS